MQCELQQRVAVTVSMQLAAVVQLHWPSRIADFTESQVMQQ
jgi:hypothetical protein